MDIEEAVDEFRAEYESSEHWGSDLIISFECAETILSELDKLNGIINLMAEQLTTPVHSKKWVIDYFTNKYEEDIKE